jgi:tetratricopeptide (TPR) repeat protein
MKPDPKALGHYQRGTQLLEADDAGGAIAAFGEAIALAPGFGPAFGMRGIARCAKEDFEGALSDFETAALIDPRDRIARHNLARALGELERWEEAIRALDEVLELDPGNPRALTDRGYARLRAGDPRGAILDLTPALESVPEQASLPLYHRAHARRAIGDLVGFRADLDAALAVAPKRGPLREDIEAARREAAER